MASQIFFNFIASIEAPACQSRNLGNGSDKTFTIWLGLIGLVLRLIFVLDPVLLHGAWTRDELWTLPLHFSGAVGTLSQRFMQFQQRGSAWVGHPPNSLTTLISKHGATSTKTTYTTYTTITLKKGNHLTLSLQFLKIDSILYADIAYMPIS